MKGEVNLRSINCHKGDKKYHRENHWRLMRACADERTICGKTAAKSVRPVDPTTLYLTAFEAGRTEIRAPHERTDREYELLKSELLFEN
jgi:hypothetical protein